jgi:hypothetical protein
MTLDPTATQAIWLMPSLQVTNPKRAPPSLSFAESFEDVFLNRCQEVERRGSASTVEEHQ